MKSEDRALAVLSVARALIGEIFNQTRAVLIRPCDRGFVIEFYVGGPVSDEMRESASCVETEVLADYPQDVPIGHMIVQLDQPQPIPSEGALPVFFRRE